MQGDHLILHYVARILELVIPLIDHAGEAFLASIEEDLMMLIIKQGQTVSSVDNIAVLSPSFSLRFICVDYFWVTVWIFLRGLPPITVDHAASMN